MKTKTVLLGSNINKSGSLFLSDLIPFHEFAILRGRWYPLTTTVADSLASHPINFLAPTPPPQIIMSLEIHPSPVTGLRRLKDELNRDADRADTCGERAEESVEVVDDKDDMGDIWLQFIGSSLPIDLIEVTSGAEHRVG